MKKLVMNCLPLLVCLIACALMLLEYMIISSRNSLIVIMALLMIFLVKLAVEIHYLFDEDLIFTREKKKILKTYGFILSKLVDIPNLKNYTVYKYDKLEQIVDKAMDFRMNIYYIDDQKSIDFLLIDGINLYIYTFKEKPEEFSKVDKYFIEIQHQ